MAAGWRVLEQGGSALDPKVVGFGALVRATMRSPNRWVLWAGLFGAAFLAIVTDGRTGVLSIARLTGLGAGR